MPVQDCRSNGQRGPSARVVAALCCAPGIVVELPVEYQVAKHYKLTGICPSSSSLSAMSQFNHPNMLSKKAQALTKSEDVVVVVGEWKMTSESVVIDISHH